MAARLATQEAALTALLADMHDLKVAQQRWEAAIDEIMDVLLAARATKFATKPSGTPQVL